METHACTHGQKGLGTEYHMLYVSWKQSRYNVGYQRWCCPASDSTEGVVMAVDEWHGVQATTMKSHRGAGVLGESSELVWEGSRQESARRGKSAKRQATFQSAVVTNVLPS